MRHDHRAGDKLFVDYAGHTIPIYPPDGPCGRPQLFVAVLGASNYTFAEATASQQLRRWWHTVGQHRYPDTGRLPDLRRRRRLQRLPSPRLEDRTRRVRRRDRPDDHRLPPTTLDQPDMTAAESKRGR